MAEKKRRKRPAAEAPAPASRGAGGHGDDPTEHHVHSPTAVAGQAMSTGVAPASRVPSRERGVPRDSDLLQVGDVETDPLQNAYVGDEAPGGDMATPDQDRVDDIGRAYGVQEADSGALRASSELLDERDRRRHEMEAPPTTHGTRDEDRSRNR
jgi:hypothetical protein